MNETFDLAALDVAVQRFMQEFEIPGLGLSLVLRDKTALARGYGVRAIHQPEPIDVDTIFAIASNSKAFLYNR